MFNAGAQFFTGDSHAVQGDGEINGTAIEASLTATLQFIVHKGEGKAMRWPRAEDAANYYTMGMDLDLDVAMREAAQETVDFLRERFGLSAADAYALASIGVDFRVAEAVDFDAGDLRRDPEEAVQEEPGLLGGAVSTPVMPGSTRSANPGSVCAAPKVRWFGLAAQARPNDRRGSSAHRMFPVCPSE